ncbi:MAG: class I SAM-dependent methyltransferase, partial [Actinomycetota bacterium]
WDERYAQADRLWSSEANPILVDETADLAAGRALDLGSGEGGDAVWLAEHGWRVTAVDFSDVALSRARTLAEARGLRVNWVLADLLGYEPTQGAFDLVAMMYVHIAPSGRREVRGHAGRALVPGGVLLVVAHDRSHLTEGHGGPQDPTILYTPEEIVQELPGLQIERAERVRRSVEVDGREATAVDTLVRARKPV